MNKSFQTDYHMIKQVSMALMLEEKSSTRSQKLKKAIKDEQLPPNYMYDLMMITVNARHGNEQEVTASIAKALKKGASSAEIQTALKKKQILN